MKEDDRAGPAFSVLLLKSWSLFFHLTNSIGLMFIFALDHIYRSTWQ